MTQFVADDEMEIWHSGDFRKVMNCVMDHENFEALIFCFQEYKNEISEGVSYFVGFTKIILYERSRYI